MWNRNAVLVAVLGCLVIAAIIGTALASEGGGEETQGDLLKFSSKEEIEAFLKEHAQGVKSGNGYPWMAGTGQETAMDAPAPTSAPPAPSAARDYSTTNVQVEGVDEADFLKNDGRYIYVISGETIAILEAFPAEDARIVSETRIEGFPTALFLAGDRLTVFVTGTEEIMTTVKGSATPVPVQRAVTHAYIYDIADRSDPERVRTRTFTGSYYDARMIGDNVYVLTREAPVWIRDEIVLPEVRTDGSEPILPDVYRPGTPLQNYVFYTASAFSVKNDRATPDAETFLLGYDTTLFASQKNLYIATATWGPPERRPTTPAAGSRRSSTGSRSMTQGLSMRPWAGFPGTS
ncbi:beta-propeller domain-containing protein [Methanoculleus sp. MH98A]|uniref:beta-propeller domain-containing protein n=1 Tax=Methanoculleus sp. MH98A TaxID=1495314 RepID=UPI000A7F4122|nr:beta-propeller domain-containing protein [Methanoculleus sp. MH98A]